jgi:HPt (histidine-containing phosphotransfer) domain-containing protein
MVPPFDDLDLSQAQAFALQPRDLAELLVTVDNSLSQSLHHLLSTSDVQALHRTLHDLKGYLGLVASASLTDLVAQADQAARLGSLSQVLPLLPPLMSRLADLQTRLRAYQAGIIDG